MLGNSGAWQRVASLRPFYLPGGDKAGRDPWRSAAALCWEAGIEWLPKIDDVGLARNAWQKKTNCPQSTAVGRLFDAAACLVGLLDSASYEGQGPMWLESIAEQGEAEALSLELEQDETGIWRLDWFWLLDMLMDQSKTAADRARCFHESMALSILHQALQIRDQYGDFTVGLSGGVFQNRLLTERAITLLQQHGFLCCLPEQLPINDGGLSFGQVIEAHALSVRQEKISQQDLQQELQQGLQQDSQQGLQQASQQQEVTT